MSDFGERVRAAREGCELSRSKLAELMGVLESKVSAIEASRQRADHEFLAAFVKVTSVDVYDLLGVQVPEVVLDKYQRDGSPTRSQVYDAVLHAISSSLKDLYQGAPAEARAYYTDEFLKNYETTKHDAARDAIRELRDEARSAGFELGPRELVDRIVQSISDTE